MRTPKYLSNSSINVFYNDRTEFYLKYLADNRPPKIPQTKPMSVGSAFDAYVKSYIVEKLFGKKDQFDIETILTKQVEKHNLEWAREAGAYAFECYKRSGALAQLMLELNLADAEPRFEFTKQRVINDIPLLGKPDVWFVTKDGLHVLIDWKVNGYCAKRPVSPKKGYILCLDGWDHKKFKPSRSHKSSHKDAQVMRVGGMFLNLASNLEDVDRDWAQQTTIYAWLMGEEIGAKFVCGIDQLCCAPHISGKPLIRVARHRSRITPTFQGRLWSKIEFVWDTIQSGHIFTDLTREESDRRCRTLDRYHEAFNGDPDDPIEQYYQEIAREQ